MVITMNILNIAIIIFIVLEFSNVIILYFFPNCRFGNGVAIFKSYKELQKDKNSMLFAKYMKNWVAGTKLIFILLLFIILIAGNDLLKIHSFIVMIISISSYYIGLHPIIKELDDNDMINPKGYSKRLFLLITSFVLLFLLSLIIYVL